MGRATLRSFRFVVIDEAFGRGSDESTRHALELFKKLNLQLLIVTPLQKIHVIEPYVANVGFVHNEDGRQSAAQPQHRRVPPRAEGPAPDRCDMSWTTPEDITAEIEKRWRRGELLAARVTDAALFPLHLRLRRPNSREIAERFGDAMDWARALKEASCHGLSRS